MATIEQENAEKTRLDAALENLTSIDPKSLVRREELGADLHFEAGLPFFSRTLKLFNDLKNCSLDGISHNAVKQLADSAEKASNEFKEIRDFSIQKHPQNAIDIRNQSIDKIRNQYDNYYNIITPNIAYSVRKGTDFELLENQARSTIKTINKFKDEYLQGMDKLRSESQEILESMRRAAAEAGVSQHAIYFSEEADVQGKAAKLWLVVTAIFGFATLAFAVYSAWFYSRADVTFSTAQSIQIAIAKVIAFSVLYFSMIWSGRNYRAHRHNNIVNKHRQNALSTFQAFVKATEDDATKNAVLIRATEAIFSPEVTGYLSREPEPKSGTSQILEVVRGVLGKQS